MDKAQAAVKDFMSKAGHHDTTVHEKVAPAVVRDTQNVHEHENVQTAVDKEIHQDHYHTSVQPVHHQERKAEQHHHNLGAVEHRNFEHGDDREVQQKLQTEQANFQNETISGEHKHTTSVNPTIGGEHIHHHVHETIQPVVHKQTIEPHVTHTTVPIHEVHHNAAQHHSTSALPAVSLSDFKKQGGTLSGREERYDGFEGEPKNMVSKAANALTGHHSGSTGTTGTTGSTGTGLGSSSTGTSGSGLTGTGHHHSGTTGATGTGLGSSTTGTSGSGLTGSGHHHSGTTGTGVGSSTTGTTGSSLTGNTSGIDPNSGLESKTGSNARAY